MKKIIYEEYKISGNRVTHMKLKSITLPEDESFNMMKKYKFDEESTKKMLEDAQRQSEHYRMMIEQKEYEEMNYDAIRRRLDNLSTLELIKRLFNVLTYKE